MPETHASAFIRRSLSAASMHSIHSFAHCGLSSINIVHLESSSGGHEYILTVVDHITRSLEACHTGNKEAKTTAEYLHYDNIPRFGISSKLLHDQDKELENAAFHYLEKSTGISHILEHLHYF